MAANVVFSSTRTDVTKEMLEKEDLELINMHKEIKNT